MGLPEGSNGKTILWIHHKVPSKIIKHDGILFIVELQKNLQSLSFWQLKMEAKEFVYYV